MKLPVQATVALTVAAVVEDCLGATPDQWRSRSIYQLLTDRFALTDGSTTAPCVTTDRVYCGGTYRGIIDQLDYIHGMGFTAIWISPVTYNIPDQTAFGYAFHGFWQQDLYRLNDHFGTADDLKALSQALHDRDMYLMVDVVVNHNGWNGGAASVDYSKFYPFNDAKYFHSYCTIDDWSNETNVEDCWLGDPLVELADLRTEDQAVADGYNQWINELASNYSIDGIRIDTVKHVGKPFWSGFNEAAGVFCTGEVLSGDAAYTCDYQNHLDSVLNYPMYWPMMYFLNSTSGDSGSFLSALSAVKGTCKDVSVLGTFTENHDLPRFASQTQDMSLAKNALALTILSDGVPIVYAGQEQHYSGYGDPGNREATWLAAYSREGELYNHVAAVNQVRNRALALDSNYATYNIYPLYSDQHTVALRKGFDGHQIISVITNTGSSNPQWTLSVTNTGFSAGSQVVEVITCNQLTVNGDGSLSVPMESGLPRVYFPVDAAAGSGICNITSTATTTSEAAPGTSETKKSRGLPKGERRWKGRKRAVVVAGLAAAAGNL
ncbi:glycoside hydrolase superfamily [Lophiotrema nucula]|uniref:alpha-amylase n=1 Tax=Lophiotrema nucula TaxID=690887 RepID=A0A6A5ZIK9_9PLEO|nr:glycoside hydrolase superfamily [Lophiotrema nucula]